jgi:polyisoprenoid-binding protein YceI
LEACNRRVKFCDSGVNYLPLVRRGQTVKLHAISIIGGNMRSRFAIGAAVAAVLASTAAAQSVSTDPKQAPTGVYQLEPRHTQIQFAVTHFGITDYFGRFDKASGTLNFSPSSPEKSSVSISIDTTSLDTPSSALAKELQGSDIFDTAHFAEATFKSTSVTRTGSNTGKIAGDLTIKGITKPVTLDVTFNGSTASPMGPKTTLIGFHATTTIKRSDFNMASAMWSPMVSDDVRLDIEAPFAMVKE